MNLCKLSCVLEFAPLIALSLCLSGCGGPDWIQPRKCAIKNNASYEATDVHLGEITLNWETKKFSLKPGETKLVSLPGNRIPALVGVGWNKTKDFQIFALQDISSLGGNYQGDILFTINDFSGPNAQFEAADLSDLEIEEQKEDQLDETEPGQ